MDYVIALFLSLLCVYLAFRMLRPRDVVDFQMGVIAAFSVGYYCLPVWFKGLSTLSDLSDGEVAVAVFIHALFIFCIVVGTEIARPFFRSQRPLETPQLDRFIVPLLPALCLIGTVVYIYYYFNFDLTSYTAKDFEAYFKNRSTFSIIVANLSGISLAGIAFSTAYFWKRGNSSQLLIAGSLLSVCILLALFLGQRLALLTPIIMLLASLAGTGQSKKAVSLLGAAVAVLLLVSPVAVFVRETLADKQAVDAKAAVGSFSYGDDAFGKMFQSIIDRGDLVYVTARMKPYIDAEPLPGLTYYGSVLAVPIPKGIYPGVKPYPLSPNGGPGGELSIKAWLTLKGGTGSLSAFGGVVAYREASWPGVIVNGLLTGALFIGLGRLLGEGGIAFKILYAQLFVAITVKKVPPSFFEALTEVMGVLPFLGAIFIVAWLMENRPALRHGFHTSKTLRARGS